MYAVIRTGGKQHRVSPGDRLKVEKLDDAVGSQIELSEVLLVEKDGKLTLGKPVINKAKVKATVLGQDRGKKITVFKKKRKKQYRRTRGHRQHFTELLVEDIKLK